MAPASDGSIGIGLINTVDGSKLDADGDGFAYQGGQNAGRTNNIAVSGIVGGDNLPAVATKGTAVYSGDYEYVVIDKVLSTSVTAQVYKASGQIDLTADLANSTLTGNATSNGFFSYAHTLDIDAKIDDGTLTGTATHDSLGVSDLTAEITGVIGADKAIGAFHGNANDDQLAGGFLVVKQ